MLVAVGRVALIMVLAPASAMGVDGQGTQTPVAVERRLERVPLKVPGGTNTELYDASYALVIGFSKYSNGWPELPGVSRDVEAVKAGLSAHGFTVELLRDPTRSSFDNAIRRFIAQNGQKPRHRLVIYVAGHGHTQLTSDGRELGYLVPVDAPIPDRDPTGFKQIAISMSEIEDYANRIESKHALFVFDSCFSGSLFEAMRSIPDAIAEKTSLPVREFITAGTANQAVPDRSVFREQFIAGLQGEADLNKDGYVTGTELGSFLEERVTNYSRRAQTPRYGKIRDPRLDKGDLVFALTAKPSPVGTTIDPELLRREEIAFWESASQTRDSGLLRSLLQEYEKRYGPNGRFSVIARARLADVGPTSPDPLRNPNLPVNTQPVWRKAYSLYFGTSGQVDRLGARARMREAAAGPEPEGRFISAALIVGEALPDPAVIERVRGLAEHGDSDAAVLLGYAYLDARAGLKRDLNAAEKWFKQAAAKGSREAMNGLGNVLIQRLDYDGAVKWYREAETRGYPPAMGNLGRRYANGQGVPKDELKALELFRRACDAWAISCFELGTQVAAGVGLPADLKQAVVLQTKACDAGSIDGCVLLANAFAAGRGVTQDEGKAADLYQRACNDGATGGCGALAEMYRTGRGVTADQSRATSLHRSACANGREVSCGVLDAQIAQLRKDCDAGTAVSCVSLGYRYYGGDGVRQDDWAAVALYRRGCDGGNPTGCLNLGTRYRDGKGVVAADPARAAALFQQACDGKYAKGCIALGDLYRAGSGVTKDEARATGLYRNACDAGDANGCASLGAAFEDGIGGLEKSPTQAATFFTKACDQSNGWGCRRLAFLHEAGNGVPLDQKRAIELWLRGCNLNDSQGCAILGERYQSGRGVEKNVSRALELYMKACDANNSWGCRSLASLYESGTAVTADRKHARELYQKACDAGLTLACADAKRLSGTE